MSALEQKIDQLDTRLNSACAAIADLSQAVQGVTTDVQDLVTWVKGNHDEGYKRSPRSMNHGLVGSDYQSGHKDILMDGDRPSSATTQGDRVLAPEMQIQRLTAQLTAAYGRIAALEEQLLSHRIH